MAAINFGSGTDTTTGDTFAQALVKAQNRIAAREAALGLTAGPAIDFGAGSNTASGDLGQAALSKLTARNAALPTPAPTPTPTPTPSPSYLPTLSGTTPAMVSSYYRLVSGYTGPVARLTRGDDTSIQADVMTGSDGFSPNFAAVAGNFPTNGNYFTEFYDQVTGTLLKNDNIGARPFRNAANDQNGRACANVASANGVALALPATLTTDRANVTAAVVAAVGGNDGALIGLGNGPVLDGLSIFKYQNGTVGGVGSAFMATNEYQPVTPAVIILNSGPSAATLRVNQRRQGVATQSSRSMAGGVSHSAAAGYKGGFYSDQYAHVVYAASLSAGDEATLYGFLKSAFLVNDSYVNQVIGVGDSIMAGQGASAGVSCLRRAQPNLASPAFVANAGISGASFATFNNPDQGWAPAVFTGKQIVINNIGSNDFRAGRTAAALQADVQPWIADRKATGWAVVMQTVLLSSDDAGSKRTEKLAYNQWLRDNATAFGVFLADVAQVAAMADPANVTYYADGVHPTDAGYVAMEPVVRAQVNLALTS